MGCIIVMFFMSIFLILAIFSKILESIQDGKYGCLIWLFFYILFIIIVFIAHLDSSKWFYLHFVFILGGMMTHSWSNNVSQLVNCPHCHQKHHVYECALKCNYTEGRSYVDTCVKGVKKDSNGWIPKDKYTTCMSCQLANKQLYCTIFTDRYISSEMIKMKSFPIALLGAKASGKSNYIGVLVQELKHKMELPFNCSLTLDNSTASCEAYDKYYYQPLYIDGYTVMATEAGIEIPPLMFPLRFYKTSKETALMFYDTAGENLDYPDSMQLFNGYISYAQGIILLLDPLQIPEIRDALIAKGFTGLPEQNTETAKVLDAVIQVIRRVANQSGQINIPLALVVTKIDVLEQYDILPADSCLRSESEHLRYGKFVMPDYERTHHEIEALIRTWLQGALMSYIRQFRYYAFFGVSALGVNPDGAKLGGDVKPRRVLDPLLWLLVKEKYVETVK